MNEKNIEFKLEFEAKLHKLGIRKIFINALEFQNKLNRDTINYLKTRTDWHSFINDCLYWGNTIEGRDFWRDISIQ
jgi:hypothetical protein